MSNILELDSFLENREKQQDEVPSVFSDVEVSEEEINSIKKDTDENGNILLIKDKDETGKEVTTSLDEYTADLIDKYSHMESPKALSL